MSNINPIWGFDPLELLKKIHFPNDESEYKVRHNRSFRIEAIRLLHGKAEDSLLKTGKLYISAPGLQVADEPLTQEELVKLKTSKIQQEQLARSAAAIIIQSCFRGWATRKRYMIIITALLSIKTHRDGTLTDTLLPGVKDLKTQDKLRKKYLRYCSYFEKRDVLAPEFSQFCASLLQAQWKRFIIRNAYLKLQEKRQKDHSGGNLTQESQKDKLEFMNAVAPKEIKNYDDRNDAALKIQKIWKKYYNSRIYLFYRDLIKIRERGHPFEMLKYINPREAQIIDQSQGLHIRFRLGGESFPPVILYKIFIHKSLIDMNAFSPRNYTDNSTKIPLPRVTFLNTEKFQEKKLIDEWYERYDSNDWRPVLHPAFQFSSNVIVQEKISKKSSLFHYSKLNRKQDLEKRKKQKKIAWIRKIYKLGDIRGDKTKYKWLEITKDLDIATKSSHLKDRGEESFDDIIQELESMEFDQSLLNWTDALNFDDYHSSWLSLATTAPSDLAMQKSSN